MKRRILIPINPEPKPTEWELFHEWFMEQAEKQYGELCAEYNTHAHKLQLYVENVHNMVLQQFPEFIQLGLWNPVRTKEGTSIPFDEA